MKSDAAQNGTDAIREDGASNKGRIAFLLSTVAGLAFFWQYIRGSFIFSFFADNLQPTGAQLAYDMAIILVGAALAFLPKVSRWLFDLHRGCTALVLAISGVVLFLTASFPDLRALNMAAALLGGISFVLLSIAWGRECVRRMTSPQLQMLPAYIALSYLLSFVVALPLVWTEWDAWFFALCPVVSAVLWYRAAACDQSDADACAKALRPKTHPQTLPTRIVNTVVIAVSGVLAGLYGNADTGSPSAGTRRYFESMLFAAVLLVLVIATARRPELNVLIWGFALLLVLIGALAMLVLQESFTMTGADILTVGRRSIWVLLWLLLMSAPERSLDTSTRNIGMFFAASFGLSRIIIDGTRMLHPVAESPGSLAPYVTLFIAALLIVCAFIITGARLLEFFQTNTAWFGSAAMQSDDLRAEAVGKLAQEYALTERETETFEQLAQGHTMPHIANELGVSASTIRSHAKAIYRKLDCHSKQDLIDLVNQRVGR